ncbi:hypothetical protein CBR_g20251 [Chara braunii]|uniref:Homeobox domain-containing protein n=1 Tax=Chara braunii TaxID=69332 RepID=A0A388L018_CHABU|nr:hypothetical protein CBR_g20251 [Chara braunii]|eukprot:GBG75621.1 hypothetical protein CBR_g20251 [Chara braunii]
MAASKSRASDGDPPDGRSHVEGGARKRIKYTDEMKLILEESFQKSMFPPRETRMALAEATGISLEQVTVWFQNRRSGRNAAGVIAASLGAAAAKNKDYDMIGGSGAGGLRDNKEGSSSREDLVGGRPDVKAELLSAEQLRERNGSPSSGGGGSYVCGTYGKGSAKGGGGGGGGGGGSSTSRVGGGELPGGGGPGELSRVGGKIVVGGYHDQQGHSHHPHAAPHIPIVSVSHLHYHNNSQSRGGGGGSVPAVEDTPPPHSSRLLPPVPSPPETAGGGVVPGIPGKPARSSSPFGGGGSVSTNRVLAPGASASLPGTGGGLLLSAKMEPEGSSILGGAGFDPVATFASRVYPTPTGSGAGAACLSAAAAAREGSPGPGSTAVALAGGYQTVMMRGRLGTPEARQQQPLGASTGSNSGVGGSNSKIEMDASGGAVVGSGTHLVYSKLPLGIGISSAIRKDNGDDEENAEEREKKCYDGDDEEENADES